MRKILSCLGVFLVSMLVTTPTFAGGLPLDAAETYAPVAEENPNHFELIGALRYCRIKSK